MSEKQPKPMMSVGFGKTMRMPSFLKALYALSLVVWDFQLFKMTCGKIT
jgi:hypothetical protein